MTQDAPKVFDPTKPFQARVKPWMTACFGVEISADKIERNHRFLEEAMELVQSLGCTQSEAHQLADYVWSRPIGNPTQEVGGAMVTLAALCLAADMDMHECGEVELARVWTKIDAIRAKQAAKPKHSPLPEYIEPKEGGDAPFLASPINDPERLCKSCGQSWTPVFGTSVGVVRMSDIETKIRAPMTVPHQTNDDLGWYWRNCRSVSFSFHFHPWPWHVGMDREQDLYGGKMSASLGPFTVGVDYGIGNCSSENWLIAKTSLSELQAEERAIWFREGPTP